MIISKKDFLETEVDRFELTIGELLDFVKDIDFTKDGFVNFDKNEMILEEVNLQICNNNLNIEVQKELENIQADTVEDWRRKYSKICDKYEILDVNELEEVFAKKLRLTTTYVKDIFHYLELCQMDLMKINKFTIEICKDAKGKLLGYAVYDENDIDYCYGKTISECMDNLKNSKLYKSEI